MSGGFGERKNLQFSKLIQKELGQWQAEFVQVGLPATTYVRSLHAARQANQGVTNEEELASMSTAGVLSLHFFWVEFRRERHRKDEVRCIMETLLSMSIAAAEAEELHGQIV